MAEILASLPDINTHLPTDKLEAETEDVALYQVDVARFIRSSLSGTFTPVVLAGWTSPSVTPDTIRSIAGMLVAAKFYAIRYAEDSDGLSEYAQSLYNSALSMLRDIKTGSLILVDVNNNPIVTSSVEFDNTDFYPNNDTTDGPYFTVAKLWA